MLLVCMKCVNCSILLIALSCSMFILSVLLLGEGCGGLFGRRVGDGGAGVGV